MSTANPLPPLAPALVRQLGRLAQVRKPRRRRVPAAVATLSLLPAAGLCAFVVRGGFGPVQPRHVSDGPFGWTVAMGLVWLSTYVGALATALLPRPREIMPDPTRA